MINDKCAQNKGKKPFFALFVEREYLLRSQRYDYISNHKENTKIMP